MLKQNTDPEAIPAAQTRVTKEELAKAISALESRKQEEAQQLEGTVVIGDVLQQLQIDAPAEDVLQEIQAIRRGQIPEKAPRKQFWNAERRAHTALLSGIVFLPVAALAIAATILNPFHHISGATTGVFSSQNSPLWMPQLPYFPHGVTSVQMDEGGFNASSLLKPMSEIPDNQPIHCSTRSLTQVLNDFIPNPDFRRVNYQGPYKILDPKHSAQSKQLFDIRPNLHRPWVLIKHDDRLYLRGWVAAKFTQEQAAGHRIVIHSSWESFDPGVQPHQLTVAADFNAGFSYGSGQTEFSPWVDADRITLDQYAWEKWKP